MNPLQYGDPLVTIGNHSIRWVIAFRQEPVPHLIKNRWKKRPDVRHSRVRPLLIEAELRHEEGRGRNKKRRQALQDSYEDYKPRPKTKTWKAYRQHQWR